MSNTNRTLGVVLFLIFLLFIVSVFTVGEGQQGIILRLGRLVDDSQTNQVKVLNPGLHFKAPFIENIEIKMHGSDAAKTGETRH